MSESGISGFSKFTGLIGEKKIFTTILCIKIVHGRQRTQRGIKLKICGSKRGEDFLLRKKYGGSSRK